MNAVSAVQASQLKPADVLVVHGTGNLFSEAIELGDKLLHLPSFSHVAMVHHTDAAGTLWCIEGRPGGVGWVVGQTYLRNPLTIANTDQPIATESRAAICTRMRQLLGTPYDYDAIMQDAERDLGLPLLWSENWQGTGLPPAHVVCSSVAAWLYAHYKVPNPRPQDLAHTEPGDWGLFIETKAWAKA